MQFNTLVVPGANPTVPVTVIAPVIGKSKVSIYVQGSPIRLADSLANLAAYAAGDGNGGPATVSGNGWSFTFTLQGGEAIYGQMDSVDASAIVNTTVELL